VVEEYQNYYNPTMIMRSNCWWIYWRGCMMPLEMRM
jgi:hypothetical protein